MIAVDCFEKFIYLMNGILKHYPTFILSMHGYSNGGRGQEITGVTLPELGES